MKYHPALNSTILNTYIRQQLNTLRIFPEGRRNCYTLRPKQDNNQNQKQKYLIRASFTYRNYDYQNQYPKFDLYLGVNYWRTIQFDDKIYFGYYEIIIQEVVNGMVQVCLVNTGGGTPFINTLELRPLDNFLYSSPFPLSLFTRRDCGAPDETRIARYKDDVYDRMWRQYDNPGWDVLKTNAQVKLENSTYELPSEILLTACQPRNNSNLLIAKNFSSSKILEQYYLFIHFSEIEKLPSGQKRIINVTFDEKNSLSQELTLEYLKPVTLIFDNITTSDVNFTVKATVDSYAPPILNAFEIYKVFPQPNFPTDTQDVNAIMEIKSTYGVTKLTWQGDPCVPSNFAWEGVGCNSSGNKIRIVSLNLNSTKVTGQIAQIFTRLEKLESLDLSNNELTGELPQFLATISNLKFLNVSENKLTGSIPKALRENANLQLSVANNPGLCELDSCDKESKFVIPLVTSIAVFVIIAILSLIIWRLMRKNGQDLSTKSLEMEIPKQKGREFSYLQVCRITDNFKTSIGKGGFGKVYFGTLEDDSRVAVKLLSPSSKQGYKEFQSEAQLLTVHHRNLVSLVGYCHENNIMALIYEYMDNGDLGQLLSEKSSNVLKWNERLQVAIDTAKGLEYLHTGCKTPIIQRPETIQHFIK